MAEIPLLTKMLRPDDEDTKNAELHLGYTPTKLSTVRQKFLRFSGEFALFGHRML